MALRISTLDLSIVVAYLVGVVALGCWAGVQRRRGGEGSHYFLAGNTLGWPIIGLAMFAANISTVHLVSFAETAYKYGMVFGNFEWMAGFTLVLLSLFFAPLYLRSRVPTLPDFLERRFNRHCRDWLTVVSIFSAVVIHIGVALYTAALVLRGILDIQPDSPIYGLLGIHPGSTIMGIDPMMFFMIVVLAVLTGLYTMVGGLLAVVWTESIQTVLLLVGAVCITAVGYYYVGGWSELSHTLTTHAHPLANAAEGVRCNWSTANFLHILRPAGDPSKQPWLGILLGYPVIGIWYWCCDQTIVQRVLAARDEKQARLGPLFCAFLKILPVFLFVLPGVMCVAMVQMGSPVFHGDAPEGRGRHLHLHGHAHVAPGAQGPGHCGHAGGGHADLLGRAELHRHAVRLRHRQAIPAANQRPPIGRRRQADHHRRHHPGNHLLAHLRTEGYGLPGADRHHLLHLAAHHGRVSLRRILEAGLRPGVFPGPGARQRGRHRHLLHRVVQDPHRLGPRRPMAPAARGRGDSIPCSPGSTSACSPA